MSSALDISTIDAAYKLFGQNMHETLNVAPF